MTHRLSQRSLDNLRGVHPLLVGTVTRAIRITDCNFVVIEGVRTKERQADLYAQGRTKPGRIVTWTMNSRHLLADDGFGRAVDLMALQDGKGVWAPWSLYEQIYQAMYEAASDVGASIVWGGHWERRDGAHFELRHG